jgi:hypothetical protein
VLLPNSHTLPLRNRAASVATRHQRIEALQEALQEAQQERDAAQALVNQAGAERATAQAIAAQALLDLAAAQAVAAAAAAAAGGGAVTGGVVTFALSPALTSNLLLDYRTGEGIKIYGKAAAPLDVLFNGDSGGLRLFLSKVQQRATQFGWTTILQINKAAQVYNLIENYGQVTIESVRLQAMAIEAANSRDTQNSLQMYTFLITSITDGLLGKVISQREQYTSVGGFLDGPSLLKVLVTILHVDTRAQASHIRQCLARLSITILSPEYNCDIQKLNKYVVVLEEGLAARGEASQDTMMNVQAAYMACKDADFVRFTKDEYGKWEQGANMSLKQYINSSLIKFKTLKMKGLWETPSLEQEQIIALTAAFTSMKLKATNARSNRTTDGKRESASSGGRTPRKDDGIFAWKGVGPKDGEPKRKAVKGKTYYCWCTHHARPLWALHKPDGFPNLCRLNPKYAELEAAHKAGEKAGEPTAADMTLQRALAAIENSDSEVEE